MAKYILTKLQIKRLLDGKYVMDGHGRKLIAGKNLKELLGTIDDHDLYDKFEVFIENGQLDMRKKVQDE